MFQRLVVVLLTVLGRSDALSPGSMRRRVASLRRSISAAPLKVLDVTTPNAGGVTIVEEEEEKIASRPVQWLSSLAAVSVEKHPIEYLPYVTVVGLVGWKGYKYYLAFQEKQATAVEKYADKAMKTKSQSRATKVFEDYNRQTYGRRKYELLLSAASALMREPAGVDQLERFNRLLMAHAADVTTALPRLTGDLEVKGEKTKVLFYAQRCPLVDDATSAELYKALDAESDAGFVDKILKSLQESAYESKLRENFVKSSTIDNTTAVYAHDEAAATILRIDDETKDAALEKVKNAPDDPDDMASGPERKSMMAEKFEAEGADGEKTVGFKAGSFSTGFRDPPKSERLIEVVCTDCKHMEYVQPRNVAKFFEQRTECPECKSPNFEQKKREDLWYDFLGRDPEKAKADEIVLENTPPAAS